MENAVAMESVGSLAQDVVRSWLRTWLDSCKQFRVWERSELLLKKPPAETLELHKKLGNTLIRTAHLLATAMEDSDCPARELVGDVEFVLRQLTASREMLHNPLPDAEVDAFLQKHFPDETPAGAAC